MSGLAILIDPDKATESMLLALVAKANKGLIQYFFVGGSLLTSGSMAKTISSPLVILRASIAEIEGKK